MPLCTGCALAHRDDGTWRESAGMRGLSGDGGRDALEQLRARAEALALPPGALPGWSSLCGAEYSLLAATIVADVIALRAALDLAVRMSDP